MKYLHDSLTSFLLVISCTLSFAQSQNIDPSTSYASFTVTNLGLDVEGKIRGMSGEIVFDPDNLSGSSFEVSLPVKYIRTGNSMRDNHLQEEEFFHAREFPTITFSSKQITLSDSAYVLTGSLSIRGISKTVSIPFSFDQDHFEGSFQIDRNDFQLGDSGFIDTIGDEVRIQIYCSYQ